MRKIGISFKVRVVGVLDILIGSFIGFWLLTIGLVITVYSAAINKSPMEFFYLGLAVAFAALFLIGGILIICKRAYCRIFLNTAWGLAVLLAAICIFAEAKLSFFADSFAKGIDFKYFSIAQCLGTIGFCSVVAALGILHIRFVNSNKVKELFRQKQI